MKINVNIDGVDYEYNIDNENLRKHEWLKRVDGEWHVRKDVKNDINKSNIEKEDYDG